MAPTEPGVGCPVARPAACPASFLVAGLDGCFCEADRPLATDSVALHQTGKLPIARSSPQALPMQPLAPEGMGNIYINLYESIYIYRCQGGCIWQMVYTFFSQVVSERGLGIEALLIWPETARMSNTPGQADSLRKLLQAFRERDRDIAVKFSGPSRQHWPMKT